MTIPDGVTSIGDYAFRGCRALTIVSIPDSVTSIGVGAFGGCTALTSVTIPDNVTSIESFAFSDCSGLTSITIPNSVAKIGSGAFYRCTGLTDITIPDSMTSIGFNAFSGCRGLTSITIPNSVAKIGSGAFSGCSGLKSITVGKNNPVYHSDGNCLIKTTGKVLLLGCKTVLYDIVSTNNRHYLLTHSGLGHFSHDKDIDEYSEEDLLWNRPALSDEYYDKVMTIFGHTPTINYGEAFAGKAIATKTWINIDTGSGWGFSPMLLCLDTLEEFYCD